MSDPRVGAFLQLGSGRMRSVNSASWQSILTSMSPVGQRGFAADTRQGPIALAARGGGKSVAMGGKFDRPSAAHPGCSSVFVAISSERARDIMMPALHMLNERHGTGIVEKRTERAAYWPNGYRLLFRGCSDRSECDKRRGTPWVAAGWDECASINPSLLEYDIHECVEPRLVDFNGQWFAGGTPGPLEAGYWYRLSSGKAGYPVHEWDARTNPYIDAMRFMLATLQRMQAVPPRDKWPSHCHSLMDIINDPKAWHLLPARFVREYLGKWVQDLTALIYRLTAKNSYRTLPITPNFWTIGCDLGANSDEDPNLDHAAITVAASHNSLPTIWLPKSYKITNVDVDVLHVHLRQELDTYKQAVVHIDSASAGKIIERTFKKWGIPIQSALKGPKLRRIQLVQSAIDNGNLQLQQDDCMALRDEATRLVWDETKTLHSEVCADDAWDSALMGAVPHFGDHQPPPPKEPEPGTPEWQALQDLKEFEAALEQAQNEARGRG